MTCWRIQLPLPPSVNEMYWHRGDKMVLTTAARAFLEDASKLALVAGFRPSLKECYSVRLWFWVPSWASDADDRIKAAIDGVFGARADHRVVSVGARKYVAKETGCVMRILQLPEDMTW